MRDYPSPFLGFSFPLLPSSPLFLWLYMAVFWDTLSSYVICSYNYLLMPETIFSLINLAAYLYFFFTNFICLSVCQFFLYLLSVCQSVRQMQKKWAKVKTPWCNGMDRIDTVLKYGNNLNLKHLVLKYWCYYLIWKKVISKYL